MIAETNSSALQYLLRLCHICLWPFQIFDHSNTSSQRRCIINHKRSNNSTTTDCKEINNSKLRKKHDGIIHEWRHKLFCFFWPPFVTLKWLFYWRLYTLSHKKTCATSFFNVPQGSINTWSCYRGQSLMLFMPKSAL